MLCECVTIAWGLHMKWLAVAVLLLALIPPQAKAFKTGMDLLEYCEAEVGAATLTPLSAAQRIIDYLKGA